MNLRNILCSAVAGALFAGLASTQTIPVVADITTSTTWTANNCYQLTRQIYVESGATLTIEAGTVIASVANVGGSLAVARGAQINILGEHDQPVIMTSSADVATWTPDASQACGGDPTTGQWREEANEWGNLTIMGRGYISENAVLANVPRANANNRAVMEGLIERFPGDPRVRYGGGNDADDSGTIRYLSLRYGGRVVSLNNELNGLSLGGIGSDTDISFVEIMNNVDDGVEIWGGKVNLKCFSIWNIGDDSVDIDQGYRGKMQFGLVVQGYSDDASQGSGVGDNMCETDGGEDSDWQPTTTTALWNMTLIGQPADGDGATAWRDNANVQYRNCIIADCGEQVVRFDNDDGDGASGYGHNGTLGWPQRWTTSHTYREMVNSNATSLGPNFYSAQSSRALCGIYNSVLYNNNAANAYTQFNARGGNLPGRNNVIEPGTPCIKDLQRAGSIVRGGLVMQRVTFIQPGAENDAAVRGQEIAPDDGFFTGAAYRGAFGPCRNWLGGWTAADAFGFTEPVDGVWSDLKCASYSRTGEIGLSGEGDFTAGSNVTLTIRNGTPGASCTLFASTGLGSLTLPGLVSNLKVDLSRGFGASLPPLDANGEATVTIPVPPGMLASPIFWQVVCLDIGGPTAFATSNVLRSDN